MSASDERLGLIAGSGRYPLELLRQARCRRIRTAVVVLDRVAVPAVEQRASCSVRLPVGALEEAARFLLAAGARRVVMAGGVHWNPFRARPRLDRTAASLLPSLLRGDDELLRLVAASLEALGLEIIAPGELAAPLRCAAGHLAGPLLDAGARELALQAIEAARELGRRDRGQAAVATAGGMLLEGRSGTDALLRRARRAPPGGVLAKLAKDGQDRRFDLPAVGPRTIAGAARAGLRAVVLQAGETLLLGKDEVLALCESRGVALVGIDDEVITSSTVSGAVDMLR